MLSTMSYHFCCKRGIRPARTEQFLVRIGFSTFGKKFLSKSAFVNLALYFCNACSGFAPPVAEGLACESRATAMRERGVRPRWPGAYAGSSIDR